MNNGNEVFLSKEQTNCVKAVAILCIVICHVMNNFTRIFTPLGGIGVALFLMTSGYGLSISADCNGLNKFWRKRLIAVVIPYFIIESVVLLMTGTIPLKAYLLDITLIMPRYALGWYLNYILICYICFFIVESIFKNKNVKSVLYLVFSVALLFIYGYTKNGIRYEQSFSFLIGIVAARYDISKCIKKKTAYLSIIFGVIVLLAKQVPNIRNIQILYDTFNLILKLSISIGIIELIWIYWATPVFCRTVKRIACFIGEMSYSIYLVHGYVGLVLFSYPSGANPILVVSIYICVSALGSIAYHYLIRYGKKLASFLQASYSTL